MTSGKKLYSSSIKSQKKRQKLQWVDRKTGCYETKLIWSQIRGLEKINKPFLNFAKRSKVIFDLKFI